MKTIDYTIPYTTEYTIEGHLARHYNKDNLLFFDIETTGFIAANTTLYLIGVLWYENHNLHIRQWFNEDGKSEKELILSFLTFCDKYTHLVHFNGIGFDLPYLKQKSDILSIAMQLEQTMSQIDIYKRIKPYKNVFALDNMKQVSIERYLNLQRDDIYSGKELINIYQRYVANPDRVTEEILLMHNHDDLLGMIRVSQILNYTDFFEEISIEQISMNCTDEQLIIHFQYDNQISLPKRLSTSKKGIYLNALGCEGTLHIPICKDSLKHYFADYKNYYYLPLEDVAIHKSIATYVENDNKRKATRQTCYTKQYNRYIPCHVADTYQIFQYDINDKELFQTVESLLDNSFENQCIYIKNTLQILL